MTDELDSVVNELKEALGRKYGILDIQPYGEGGVPAIMITVSGEWHEDGERRDAVAKAVGPLRKGYNVSITSRSPTALTNVKRVQKSHILPYTQHGIPLILEGMSRPTRTLHPLTYSTNEEVTQIRQVYEMIHYESRCYDLVVGVARGGMPVLNYLCARFCYEQFETKYPTIEDQVEACRKRFHLVSGLRSGYNRDLAITGLRDLIAHARSQRVLIIDVTFGGGGIVALTNVLKPLIAHDGPAQTTVLGIVDLKQNEGRRGLRDHASESGLHLDVKYLGTPRVITEDLSEALGYVYHPASLALRPVNSLSAILIERDASNGWLCDTGTLANMLHELLLCPNLLSDANIQSIEAINDSLRRTIQNEGGAMGGPLTESFQAFMKDKTTAFQFGQQIRAVSIKTKKAVGFICTPKTGPKIDKLVNHGVRVMKEGTEGPYILVPESLVAPIVQLLEGNSISFRIRDMEAMTEGNTWEAVIDLTADADTYAVQAVLDAVFVPSGSLGRSASDESNE